MADAWSGRIFISYRRKDTGQLAGRLLDWISLRFPKSRVFIDVESIQPGLDFATVIDMSVRDSDVFLAIIGSNWNTLKRTAEDPDYYVLEIRTALQHDVRVVPVLADGATMPDESDMPTEIRDLARKQGVRLAQESFKSDVSRLLDFIASVPVQDRVDSVQTLLPAAGRAGSDPPDPTESEEPAGPAVAARQRGPAGMFGKAQGLARSLVRGSGRRRAVVGVVIVAVLAVLAAVAVVAVVRVRGPAPPSEPAGCGLAGDRLAGPPPIGTGLRVGVIFPERVFSNRWECFDRPLLDQALRGYGLEPDIQNAQGDPQRFTAIADSMINNGAKVLIINSPTNEAGIAVARKAQVAGVPVIDYDRLTVGGSSEYHVMFDYGKVGELQAQSLVQGLGDKTTADLIAIGGAPTDYNATLIEMGQNRILQPKYATGDFTIVAERIPNWDPVLAESDFERTLAGRRGRVDGVLAANDAMAAAVIGVLRRNGLSGKVPVTGLDATPASLRAILRGDQYMTVFKPIADEADATARLASFLARGDRAEADKLAPSVTVDPDSRRQVKTVLLTPVPVTKENVKRVVDDGFVQATDICTEDVVTACKAAGIG